MQHPKRSLSLLAQLIPLTCLLLLCGIPTATAADGCLLKRTPEVCPQGKQAQEIFCLRKENTLRAVMDCVSYSSVGVDHKLCSSRNDGIPGNGFEDFGQPFEGELTDITANCLAPRLVLVSASLVCLGSSLGGLLQSCPEGDPNFFSCLCNHHVQADSFAQLSKCFSPSNQNDLNCFSFAKRKEYVKRDDYEPPPGMVSNMKRSLLPLQGVDFYLDDFARPVYQDGSIGYPLPYYDRAIRGRMAIRRCFISPLSTDRWCISWRVSQQVGADWDGGGYVGATYGNSFDEDRERTAEEEDSDDEDFPEPTRTEAPSTTVLPTLAPVTDTPLPTVSPEDDENAAQPRATSSGLGLFLSFMALSVLHIALLL